MSFVRCCFALWGVAWTATTVEAALVAAYTHEQVSPLTDDSGNGFTLTNGGSVQFVAPGSTDWFQLGQKVADFTFSGSKYLGVPSAVYTPGSDFTFTTLVRRDSSLINTGHQTILSSDRFRLQWRILRDNVPGVGLVIRPGTEQLHLGLRNTDKSKLMDGSSANGSFGLDAWYFLAMRFKAATGEVDAFLQQASGTLAPPVIHLAPSFNIGDMTGFRLGLDGLSTIGSGDAFLGEIDGARFYDTWLDNGQLQAVLQQEYWAPEPAAWMLLVLGGLPLIGWLRAGRRPQAAS